MADLADKVITALKICYSGCREICPYFKEGFDTCITSLMHDGYCTLELQKAEKEYAIKQLRKLRNAEFNAIKDCNERCNFEEKQYHRAMFKAYRVALELIKGDYE